MKKNFFKKLSFVMALAMIVTALAPAAGVFAAAAPKLNAKTVYIHVAEKTTDFDFNVANKKTGWKYSWKSSNKDVAEVASNGLTTAVGKGTATISVTIKDKKGEKVDTLKATVVVRDNIKKLTITNTPAGNKLAVGAKNDFNRSYVTASGSKTKTSGITRWEVDKTGATIVANSGLFTATEAGTYKITARAFQSTAKYNSWLADKTKYASYVTASTDYTVTVAASMVKAEQVDLDTLKVTFDSPVTDAATKLSVAQVIGTTEVLSGIKSVTMSADNKEATVDMNANFTEEYVYKVKYPELTDVQFTAAKVDAALVTSIAIKTTTVQEGRGTDVDVALYNKDMVNIANSTLLGRVTLETSATNSSAVGRTLYLYTKGSTTTVKATYHTWNYDTSGAETGTLTASGVITCVDYADYLPDSVKAYTIKDAATPDWVSVSHKVAVGDTGYRLFAKLAGKKFDGTGEDKESHLDSNITFQSSNINILIIDPNTGYLTPVAAGTASVVVKYGDKIVGAIAVEVAARRSVASVSLDTYGITLSNIAAAYDTKEVALTVKDNLGDKMDPDNYNFSFAANNTSFPGIATPVSGYGAGEDKDHQQKYLFNAAGATAGTYSYTYKVTDKNTNASFPVTVSVTVKTTTDLTPDTYKVEVEKTSYDMNLDKNGPKTADVKFSVFGYSSDNVKVTKENVATTGALNVTLTKDGGIVAYTTTGAAITDGVFALVDTANIDATATTDTAITKKDKGTYILTLKDSTGAQKYTTNFVVTDTQVKPVVTQDKSSVAETNTGDILQAIKDAFIVTLDGYDVESDIDLAQSTYHGTSSTNQWVIEKLVVKEKIGTHAYVKHVIDVNKVITITQK